MAPEAQWLPPESEEARMLGAVGAELISFQARTEEEIAEACSDADALLSVLIPLSRKSIERLQTCKVISRYGIGVDNIDVRSATEHGIIVANVPDFCWDEVADTAMALILALERKVAWHDRNIRAGRWQRGKLEDYHAIRGQTLGLLGFGHIARAVALRASAFGFAILAYDPYLKPESIRSYPVRLVSLEELLRLSDVLSLHTPLTPETEHLISERELRMMKPTAYLVNTSRGAVVEEDALITALKEGWIAGAGLDVYEKEPLPQDSPLLELPNVVLTPHIASCTVEAFDRLRQSVIKNVVEVLSGRAPASIVNPEVLDRPNLRLRQLQTAH